MPAPAGIFVCMDKKKKPKLVILEEEIAKADDKSEKREKKVLEVEPAARK